jgi:hypothetical protein
LGQEFGSRIWVRIWVKNLGENLGREFGRGFGSRIWVENLGENLERRVHSTKNLACGPVCKAIFSAATKSQLLLTSSLDPKATARWTSTFTRAYQPQIPQQLTSKPSSCVLIFLSFPNSRQYFFEDWIKILFLCRSSYCRLDKKRNNDF